MKYLFPFWLLLISTFSFGQSQNNDRAIVKSILNAYKNYQSIYYNLDYSIKYFDEDSMTHLNAQVLIKRDTTDEVFGGLFYYIIQRDDEVYKKYYDKNWVYVIDNTTSSITKYQVSNDNRSIIDGSIDGDVLNSFFLPTVVDSIVNSQLEDNIFTDSGDHIIMKLKIPSEEDFNDFVIDLYFNRTRRTIDKIYYSVNYLDQQQINLWEFKDITFNGIQDNTFKNLTDFYFKNYTISNFVPRTEESLSLMAKGTNAPALNGKLYPNYSKNHTVIFDKITILDFWYMSCMPCIKAIPELNKLKEKYKDNIQIIGVNPYDIEENKQNKIMEFMKRTPINYNILLTDSIPEKYNVHSYPTIYILDKNGQVIYARIGYEDGLFDTLDEIINGAIN